MSPNADPAGPVVPVPMSPGAGAWPEADGDLADALQLDFDAPELPGKRSGRLEWKSPEKAASIKEAIQRWLDEQL